MPLIYRIKCEACGKEPIMKSFVAGWVTTDREKGGTILPDGYMALKRETGEFVCLPHPIEHRRLESYGYTWDQAVNQGRLFDIKFKICTTCGLINEDPEICHPQIGCFPVLIASAVSITLFKWLLKLNWPLTLLLGICICYAVACYVDYLNKLRRLKGDQNLRLNKCSACSGVDFIEIPQIGERLMPCPLCKAQAMKYTGAGIS